jgi:hypothetical protein
MDSFLLERCLRGWAPRMFYDEVDRAMEKMKT